MDLADEVGSVEVRQRAPRLVVHRRAARLELRAHPAVDDEHGVVVPEVRASPCILPHRRARTGAAAAQSNGRADGKRTGAGSPSEYVWAAFGD